MVTLVWGGGEGVLGEGSPPPWFLIILKKPWLGVTRAGSQIARGGEPGRAEAILLGIGFYWTFPATWPGNSTPLTAVVVLALLKADQSV